MAQALTAPRPAREKALSPEARKCLRLMRHRPAQVHALCGNGPHRLPPYVTTARILFQSSPAREGRCNQARNAIRPH